MAPSHHQASQAISPVRDSPNREVQNAGSAFSSASDVSESLHEALSLRLADGGRCQLCDGRSEDQGAFTNRFAMSTRARCPPEPLRSCPPPFASRSPDESSPRHTRHVRRAHLPTPLTSLAVVLGGRGRPPQGRGEVRLGQVAVHPERRAPVQDPAPALERGLEGAQIARPKRASLFGAFRRKVSLKKETRQTGEAQREARAAPPLHPRTSDTCLAPLFLHDRINGETCTPGSIPREGRTRCVSRRLSVPASRRRRSPLAFTARVWEKRLGIDPKKSHPLRPYPRRACSTG